jgi:hypothetical protein
MVFRVNYDIWVRLSNTSKILAFTQCFVKGEEKTFLIVAYILNIWNQAIAELKMWQEFAVS